MSQNKNTYHHGNLAEDILKRAVQIIDEDGLEALTLRGIARDLNVSHAAPNKHFKNKAALLTALATKGWQNLREATLLAKNADSPKPNIRLNAMGRGFLRWALHNPALFRTLHHPDVKRIANSTHTNASNQFTETIREAVAATQANGYRSDVPLEILVLFTTTVPFGAAMLLNNPLQTHAQLPDIYNMDEEVLIEQLTNLVVPID